MKKTEIILFVLICIAFIMKIMNVSYSAILISYSMLLLAMLYSVFGFALLNGIRFRSLFKKENYKAISTLRIVAGIGLGFIFSGIVIFSLFKIQFWPYGQVNLLTMLMFLVIASIIIVVFYIKNKKRFLQINRFRLFIISLLSLSLYLVSTDTLVDLYYGENPNKERPEYYEVE